MKSEPVTILRKTFTGRDVLGKAIWVESQIVLKAVVAPKMTTKVINGVTEYTYDSQYSLYFPAGTNILADDMFIVRGVTFWKDGNPFRWDLSASSFNPAGVEVLVRTKDGEDS